MRTLLRLIDVKWFTAVTVEKARAVLTCNAAEKQHMLPSMMRGHQEPRAARPSTAPLQSRLNWCECEATGPRP